jgi:hypothetical protein
MGFAKSSTHPTKTKTQGETMLPRLHLRIAAFSTAVIAFAATSSGALAQNDTTPVPPIPRSE